jgi:hypothetical protein
MDRPTSTVTYLSRRHAAMDRPPKRTILRKTEGKVGIVIQPRDVRSRKFDSILGRE